LKVPGSRKDSKNAQGSPNRITINSPVGPLVLAADEEALTELRFKAEIDEATGWSNGASPILKAAAEQLADYFGGRRRAFDLPLKPEGTVFQQTVWRALGEVPFGTVISYGELARRIGRPTAVRAVGAANGANPISIILPCHRVIGSSQRLTGYGGGLDAKRLLLQLEGIPVEQDRVCL